jgi:ectoine hydroxylase-related dioxygenase (phytanoyl-CoA dioxygenase family)
MPTHTLSPEQIEQYRTDGFVVVESVFTRDDLDSVDRTIRELTDAAIASDDFSSVMELEPDLLDGERVPRRIYNPFEQHGTFRNLATDSRVLDRIESLIGHDIQLQHSKLNMKPAKVGSIVEWHQDLAYFPHTNDDLVTTLVYLDDAIEENGCLQVLPRHHTHYFDHRLPDGLFAGMITEQISDGRFGRAVALPAPAGSVIFMHAMVPHSSLPNRSDRGRRTLIFEYRAADAFPIFVAGYSDQLEDNRPQLRGQAARFARFGGPSPMIPQMGDFKSLYELQKTAKATGQTASQLESVT